jgi:hypothetical protein
MMAKERGLREIARNKAVFIMLASDTKSFIRPSQ